MPSSQTVIAHQNDTVDLIAWRVFERTADVTEAILDANPGLAALGPIIPAGTRATIPTFETPATSAPEAQLVRLWT